MAAIGGGQVDIHHLDRRELFQDGARRQAGCELTGLELERDLQAVGDEGHQDVGFDAVVKLMVNRPQAQSRFSVP